MMGGGAERVINSAAFGYDRTEEQIISLHIFGNHRILAMLYRTDGC